MSNDESAVPRLVAIDRRQLFLRTVDVEKLVERCARSIWELVGRLDLAGGAENSGGVPHPLVLRVRVLTLFLFPEIEGDRRVVSYYFPHRFHNFPVH